MGLYKLNGKQVGAGTFGTWDGVHSRGLGSDILDTPAWQQCLQF
jgi:hypothetical protein